MRLPFPRPLIWVVQLPEGTGTKQLVGAATAVGAECQRRMPLSNVVMLPWRVHWLLCFKTINCTLW